MKTMVGKISLSNKRFILILTLFYFFNLNINFNLNFYKIYVLHKLYHEI